MLFSNLSRNHFEDQQVSNIDAALQLILEHLADMSEKLTPKQRSQYGKIGNQQELLIEKTKDYYESQSEKSSPDIDWAEFMLDYEDRKTANQMLFKVRHIEQILMNIKILADYDNYKTALSDYRYAQYKNGVNSNMVFSLKIDDMKQFFPKTGKTSKNKKGKEE